MVGTVVGYFCGIALAGLPVALPYFIFSITGCRYVGNSMGP